MKMFDAKYHVYITKHNPSLFFDVLIITYDVSEKDGKTRPTSEDYTDLSFFLVQEIAQK